MSRFLKYLLESTDKCKFPLAGDEVEGLIVREEIPNTSSISATFTNYTRCKGIREVPFSAFDTDYEITTRIKNLAAEIEESGEINPLIVVIDEEPTPYILEGGHRFNALHLLGKKSFPALVILDED